jgi:hypothetical protein
MEEMKKSNSGFLAVLAANNLGFGLLALAEIYAKLLASNSAKRACYDMFKISHTEPSYHGNITHWTHMEEMKRSSSGFLAVLVANNLNFGLLALAEIYA